MPKLATILMTALNACQRPPTSAGRVVQECATCRDVHIHILKPALHFPSHSCSNTAAKLLLFRGPCRQRIDVRQLEQMEYPSLMHQACDVEIVEYNLEYDMKLLMTWTESTDKRACTCTWTFWQRHFCPAFGHAKKRETARTSNITTSSTLASQLQLLFVRTEAAFK